MGPVEWLESKAKILSPFSYSSGSGARVFPKLHGKGLKVRPSQQKRGFWGGEVQNSVPSYRDQLELFLPYVAPHRLSLCSSQASPNPIIIGLIILPITMRLLLSSFTSMTH